MQRIVYPRLGETYYEHRLANGLMIRVTRRPGFHRTLAYFATNYGAVDTAFTLNGTHYRTPDGVAHYLEHKMFDMPYGDAMNVFAKTGASPNAYTSYSTTAYYFECTDSFAENLRTLLSFVSTPYFTEQSVQKERGIIAQEIRMYEDSPSSRVGEDLFSVLFSHHPIRVPIAGTVESIAEITPKTLYDCHSAFYAPSNMILCVVGDVDPEVVISEAEQLLPKELSPTALRDYGAEEPEDCTQHVICRKMDVSMPMFELGFKCNAPKNGTDALQCELLGDLAGELLAGESSPLYSRLYEENLIDSDFSIGYEEVKGAAFLSASGDSMEPEKVRDAIWQEADRLLRDGPDEGLFLRLKRSAYGRRLRELDSFEAICSRMAENYFDGSDYYTFPELFDAVTPEEVLQFLRRSVRPERTALSVILPKENVL